MEGAARGRRSLRPAQGRIKETWGNITDDELRQAGGKWDRLVGTIKEKTGESAETIERKLREWMS